MRILLLSFRRRWTIPAFLRVLGALAFCFATAVAWGHPFHVSIAEAEYNAATKMLEVALQVHPTDLEAAVRRQSGQRIVLETSANADEQIVAYLRRSFVVKPKCSEPTTLRWVGKEVAVKHAWLYFEVSLPQGLEGVEITNSLFFELLPDQVNTMTVRDGKRRATLHFTRRKMTQKLVWE